MLLRIRTGIVGVACIWLAACGGGGSPSPSATVAPTASPTIAPTASPSPTATPTATPVPTATPSPITITDDGSTNRKMFTITVEYDDNATIVQDGSTRTATVTAAETTQFFSDVIANAPLTNVATNNGCNKSASYGSITTLTYMGSSSQDISCPPSTTSPAQTLYNDVVNIEGQVGPFNN